MVGEKNRLLNTSALKIWLQSSGRAYTATCSFTAGSLLLSMLALIFTASPMTVVLSLLRKMSGAEIKFLCFFCYMSYLYCNTRRMCRIDVQDLAVARAQVSECVLFGAYFDNLNAWLLLVDLVFHYSVT